MDNSPSAPEVTGEVEAVAKEVALSVSEEEVLTAEDSGNLNSDTANIIIKVSTAGSSQSEKKVEKDKTGSNDDPDNDTSYVCDFCSSPVKTLDNCDICQKWACKVCVGVSSVKKMTTISALTHEAKGLFWCCDTCRKDTHIKDVEMDPNTKIELIKEKIKEVGGEEKVDLEDLVHQLEIKDKELKDKNATIEHLSNERTVLNGKIEKLKENSAQLKASDKSKKSDKEDVSLSNTLEKVTREKETLLQKLQSAMCAVNEEKKINRTVKDECSQLKEDIKRNDVQLVKLESKVNNLTSKNKDLDKEVDDKIAEVIQCRQEAVKANELYKRELARNSVDIQNEPSLRQVQGFKEEIFSLRKNLTEADQKYAMLYNENLVISGKGGSSTVSGPNSSE